MFRRRGRRQGGPPQDDPAGQGQLDGAVFLAGPSGNRRRVVGIGFGAGDGALRRGSSLLFGYGPVGVRSGRQRPRHPRRRQATAAGATSGSGRLRSNSRSRSRRSKRLGCPVLCAIQGACVGGAIDMVTAADMRYATQDAFFSIAEINIGMTADRRHPPEDAEARGRRDRARTGLHGPEVVIGRGPRRRLRQCRVHRSRSDARGCHGHRRNDRVEEPDGRVGHEADDATTRGTTRSPTGSSTSPTGTLRCSTPTTCARPPTAQMEAREADLSRPVSAQPRTLTVDPTAAPTGGPRSRRSWPAPCRS